MKNKRFVYILRSDTHPEHFDTGLTSDVASRLRWHNDGPCGVTVSYRPWSLVVALEFTDAKVAGTFERYPKTGSGRAFTKRHFGEHTNKSGERPTTGSGQPATEHAASPARQNLERDRRHHNEQEDRHEDR